MSNYLSIAARNNPEVISRFYEYQAALQKVPQAGGLPDPQFQLGVFVQPMELVAGNEVADLKLEQMFPWFGTLKAAKDEAGLMADAKFESFRDAKLGVYFDVRQSWYVLLKLKTEIRIAEKNLEILKTIERLTLVKYKAAPTGTSSSPEMTAQPEAMGSLQGATGLADLYRIRIEIADMENNIFLLENQVTTETARFNSFLNRPPLSGIALPDSLIAENPGISLESFSDSVIARNPMLAMLNFEGQSLDAKKKMVTRMGYPMLGLGVDYQVISKSSMSESSMNGVDMVMPMATLTLPIYRGKYNAMKKEAELMKTANEQDYRSAKNSLQTEFYEASQMLKDGERRIKLYENQSNLAERTLEIMLSGFAAAGTPLTDILRIRQQTLDYELKKTEAIADYNTGVAWLQRLMANETDKNK